MASEKVIVPQEDDDSTASENDDDGVEQLFSHEEKKEAVSVQVSKIIQPNKMILKIQDQNFTKEAFGMLEVDLGHQFYSFQTSGELVKSKVDFRRKMQVVVQAEILVEENCESNEEENLSRWEDDDEPNLVDDSQLDSQFHRGVILHGAQGNSNAFTVFLYDVGAIKDVSMFEISPLNDEALQAKKLHPRFILMTIPGIVPRDTRLDTMKIPGMASYDRQAADWNPESLQDVESWISKQKVVLFNELMSICDNCLFYGDLYGSNEECLSKYLTRKRNVFFEYKFLKQIYAKENEELR